MRAALRVGAATGVMRIFSSERPLANALVGATSVAMESRPSADSKSNTVASKDKKLSFPSADPEGGAQDARRFPIEQDASRKIPTATDK
jgi:hypothetical protein